MGSPRDFYRGVMPPALFRTVRVVGSRVGQRKAQGGPPGHLGPGSAVRSWSLLGCSGPQGTATIPLLSL